MNVPKCIECPSCGNSVKPLRRKAPRADVENVSPTIDFGWFCPVDSCTARLDRAIAALQSETETVRESETIDPNDIPEDILPRGEKPSESTKPAPKRVVPIRPPNPSEDLFARITRERDEAIAEERDLSTRLEKVRERLAKLDRLHSAMNEIEPIAAE
jgi:hypothetical protein